MFISKSRHLTFVHNGNITSGSKHMINKKLSYRWQTARGV